MTVIFGAQGVQPTLRGQASNVFTLQPGETQLIPAGTWDVATDSYTCLQQFDPVTTTWRTIGGDSDILRYQNSDGVNFRLANLTGCVVGALVTTAGSGYTSAPTVTDNGGGSVVNTYIPIIGGAVSGTITVVAGGSNYKYPPQIAFSAPPAPGVQATGYCTIASGAVSTVTITNQGAGYTAAPAVSVINDPRDSTGTGAIVTCVLTGSQTLTALLVNPIGSVVNNTFTGTVPTITISGGGGSSAAATTIMCWTTTAYTVTSAGSGYAGNVLIQGYGGFPSTSAAYTNPAVQSGLVRITPAVYAGALSSLALTTAGATQYQGGIFPGLPTGFVSGFATPGSAALASFTMGSANGTTMIYAV